MLLSSDSQKRAIDAVLMGIDQQQQNMQNDAVSLQRLQAAAQGAAGQLEAIGYANQLASQEINQLLHLRALLTAQHNAVAAKMQADADLAAQAEAVHRAMTKTTNFQASPAVNIMSLLPP